MYRIVGETVVHKKDIGNSNQLTFTIDEFNKGLELKEILYGKMKLSSRLVRKLKRNKNILVNGNKIPFHAKMRVGDIVQVIMEEEPNQFEPENIPIEIVYEDMDILIINKNPGIVVHPTKGHPTGTLANALVYYMQEKKEQFKIRFVNRLDRDTSGLVMVAKNPFAQQELSKQMQEDKVEKLYLSVVKGVIREDEGIINAPTGRIDPDDILRKVHDGGQTSITHFEVIQRLMDATLIRLKLETGRTHQIRVHMEHIGYPLIGDTLYGYVNEELIGRQALHAEMLEFNQPRTNERIKVKADIPKDIKELVAKLSI